MKKLFRYAAVLAVAGMFIAPAIAGAQSVADLQAQIAALLQQLHQLQAQLNALQGGGQFCYDFTYNLGVGSRGGGVAALQTALQKEEFTISSTGVYDEQTASAVTGFQEKYKADILTPNGLQYGTGYVGKSTRAKLNALYECGNTTSSVLISSLSPSSGPVGTQVTITGSGFTATGNVTYFGGDKDGVKTDGNSSDGKTLIFTVPSTAYPGYTCSSLNPDCPAPPPPSPICAGTYNVAVTNANGTSNNLTYTVSVSPSGCAVVVPTTSPTISSLSPSSGPVGTQVTITGSGFTASGDRVKFGNLHQTIAASSLDGATLTFTVPEDDMGGCPDGGACPMANFGPVCNGSYNVSVTNANGTSNSLIYTVTGVPASSNWYCGGSPTVPPSVSSLSPSSGPVGTQVTITGSGFTATNNTVNFDYGTVTGIASSDGIHLTFQVNATMPPCTYAMGNSNCIQVGAGSDTVSVTNANGTSNQLTFTVTASTTSIMVTSPATGTTFTRGNIIAINWLGGTPNVVLSLWQNNSLLYYVTGTSSISNTGSYAWTIPQTYSGSGFTIGVGSVGVSPGYSGSSGAFSIAQSY